MNANKRASATVWTDPDDAPELTDAFFERADQYQGEKLVKRGRPKAETTKVSTTIRLSPEVIDYFKSTGTGWQTRIDEVLKRQIKRKRA